MSIPYTFRKILMGIPCSLLPALCLLLMIAVLLLHPAFLCLLAPEKIQGIEQLSTVTPNYSYVILENAQLNYTGYDCMKNQKVIGQYFYVQSEQKCYFFLLKPVSETSLSNPLHVSKLRLRVNESHTQYQSLLMNLSNDIHWSANHLSQTAPDYILTENQGEYIYCLFFILFLLLLSLWLIGTLLRKIFIFLSHTP